MSSTPGFSLNSKVLAQKGRTTFLLTGKHGSLTDTIILAQANEAAKTVKLLSIPRDLFYNGRKINSYYMHYGLREFVRKLEELSGLKIENYALIDMYAFIDLVDAMGGIDLTLSQAVIDPSYRTVDDGVEGTLYFAAGAHHLNGVQALRLARTRHTSSDFARAGRQQQILQAIQTRLHQIGLSDPNLISSLIKIAFSKLESDVDLSTAITLYLKYKDYKIINQGVLSTANILQSSYQVVGIDQEIFDTDCQAKVSKLQGTELAKSGAKIPNSCAYVLLPKDNDWEAFRKYLRGQFN